MYFLIAVPTWSCPVGGGIPLQSDDLPSRMVTAWKKTKEEEEVAQHS